jgi:enamine deaminase RidA (YjgF/YER057c/UK114 family)
LVFTAGIVGWDEQERFAADFVGQFRQVLVNTLAVLAEADARPEHIVRMTWYVTSRNEYVACAREAGAVYRELVGRHYPAMAVVEVSRLVEPAAKLEIETTAVVPDA